MNLIQLRTEVTKILNGYQYEEFLLVVKLWSDSDKAPEIVIIVYAKNDPDCLNVIRIAEYTYSDLLRKLRAKVGNNFKTDITQDEAILNNFSQAHRETEHRDELAQHN